MGDGSRSRYARLPGPQLSVVGTSVVAETDGEHMRLWINPRAEYPKAGELEASLGIVWVKAAVVNPTGVDQPAK